MQNKNQKCLVFLLSTLFIIFIFPSRTISSFPWSSNQRTTQTGFAYLPIARRNFPFLTVFGVETRRLTQIGGLTEIVNAQTSWIRLNRIVWSELQPLQPPNDIDWSPLSELENELINAANNNITPILIVRGTPEWAQLVPGFGCGPIAHDHLSAFGDFLYRLVDRLSQPPYNVKFWELWNEPDAAPTEVPDPNSQFGCWGDPSDAYYGGGYYADMLKTVYPRIKDADPEAKVLIGGLLLYCDPRDTDLCNGPNGDLPPKFFEGILLHNGANDGGNYFDGISFHAYDFYLSTKARYESPSWGSTGVRTNPSVIAKSEFIREKLAAYSLENKFLINTETALLCDTCEMDQDFEITKAGYLVQSYASAIAKSLRANIWYNIFGWRNSGLLKPNLDPLPAYNAYQFSRQLLQDASFIGEIGQSDVSEPDVINGFKYSRDDIQIWVIWSMDGLDYEITLSRGTPAEILDLEGNALTPSSVISANFFPKYILWTP